MGPVRACSFLVAASRGCLGHRSPQSRLRSQVSLDGSIVDSLGLVHTVLPQLEAHLQTSPQSWPELLDSTRMVFYGAVVKPSKINPNSGLES